jgi:heme A synthase
MSQMTDSRGFRSGAALSVVLLLVATYLYQQLATQQLGVGLIVAIALAMLLSAATSLRVSLLALPFRLLRERGVISAPKPADLQPAPGLRLAQVMGGTMILGGVILQQLIGASLVSVGLVAIVAALQTLLAITGICVACKLYGIVVWFENRKLPEGVRPLPRQKINMGKRK